MGPRMLDVAMTDEGYEALRRKLLETYSVRPTLSNPTVKRLVDWHCLDSSCFWNHMVFGKREKWMRHHQRFHNRMCEGDRGYPKEVEAKQFIQEHDRRESARLGIAGAGGSARLLPPSEAPTGPQSRVSGALRAIPVNPAAPSSSTSGAFRGASPFSGAPNSPRSEALRNSTAVWRRGLHGPYRPRANRAARRQDAPDQGFAPQDNPESFGTSDAAGRENLMQQLHYNLQAVSRINADSVRIIQILGMPTTNCVSEIYRPAGSNRPRESPSAGAQGYPASAVATPRPLPNWVDWSALASTSRSPRGLQAGGGSNSVDAPAAHFNLGPAHVFRATPFSSPFSSPALAHSNEGPACVFEATPSPSQAPAHPSLELTLSVGGPIARTYEGPLFIERPAHPYEAPAHLAPTNMTQSQPKEKEEENHNAASDSDEEYIYQATDASNEDDQFVHQIPVSSGQGEWRDVKVEAHAAGKWPAEADRNA